MFTILKSGRVELGTLPPEDLTCDNCGHQQADMGRDVACEECGERMPEGAAATEKEIGCRKDLKALIEEAPGSFAVKLWNQLPGVTPILTPKFRNRATAVERIWNKLAELYPDAILPEDMPKKKQRGGYARKRTAARADKRPGKVAKNPRKALAKASRVLPNGGKSAWAQELTEALRKRFNPGQEFSLEDVYKLIPAFQRRHKENHHIAARLRTTLAQDLRGQGIVKAAKGKQRGRYVMG